MSCEEGGPPTKNTPKPHRTPSKPKYQRTHDATHPLKPDLVASDVLNGFPMYWPSWNNMLEAFKVYIPTFLVSNQHPMITPNKQIVAANARAAEWKVKMGNSTKTTGGTLLGEAGGKYSCTFLCTHAMLYEKKSAGKKVYSKVRSTTCTARVNVTLTLQPSGEGYHLVIKSGAHDHPLTVH
ncbi:hypothetical protein PHMEG_00017827 [Phytophthora megakarya]|uniref:Uncharacterized protein n=1 Tax=Phytophthora megakarya TaxID=4795 RepID=A0A225VWC0_9STRA|nr:hypothetical protein PHMEG_00017827 [Phytophthora megakarya]